MARLSLPVPANAVMRSPVKSEGTAYWQHLRCMGVSLLSRARMRSFLAQIVLFHCTLMHILARQLLVHSLRQQELPCQEEEKALIVLRTLLGMRKIFHSPPEENEKLTEKLLRVVDGHGLAIGRQLLPKVQLTNEARRVACSSPSRPHHERHDVRTGGRRHWAESSVEVQMLKSFVVHVRTYSTTLPRVFSSRHVLLRPPLHPELHLRPLQGRVPAVSPLPRVPG